MAKGKYQEWITEEGLLILEGWARDGLTDEQIAHNIGIRRETLYDWKKKHPNITNALKKGKEVIDRQVENAMLRSALGFHYEEDHVTPGGDVFRVEKYERPNTTAQIFWLKNRKPKQWRDKQDVEHSGTVTNNVVDLSHLSDEELEKALNKYGDS
ncbi:hypothetical protein [Jeotgalibacillus campisalis]|uniref:Uncharacterized protein n=1 Tax=Jeotgalibacillus campisalis TaxID=220754 RepID=A0A0C2RWN5_9BACL|nr:hypothetical protein [Jeotgalibacillus campisalis]KIL46169.1 hypothetical protein KR50_28440 [Jeotgalibacillus campisalis]